MRVVSYGTSFIGGMKLETGLTKGQLGFCSADGTDLKTSNRPEPFVVMSTIPTKKGGLAIQRGININPFNFTYEVRKYDGTYQRETIVVKGITNPALEAKEGIVYPADAEFCGALEFVSSIPYRQGLVENPNPQIISIPVRFRATDTIDQIICKLQKAIVLTTYNRELFNFVVEKGDTDTTAKITVTALKDNRLRVNLFGIIKDQECAGTVTIEHTKLSGFLDLVGLSEEDNRYSSINYGWNPHDEWQDAWGLGDPKQGLDKVGYIVISTAEFNQFPEIAADNNCPRKYQIIVMPNDELDKAVTLLKTIKTLAKDSADNGISLNTVSD